MNHYNCYIPPSFCPHPFSQLLKRKWTSLTQLAKSRRGVLSVFAFRMIFFPFLARWTEAGLTASSDQCLAPDCTVKRRTGGQSQLSDDKGVSMLVGLL